MKNEAKMFSKEVFLGRSSPKYFFFCLLNGLENGRQEIFRSGGVNLRRR